VFALVLSLVVFSGCRSGASPVPERSAPAKTATPPSSNGPRFIRGPSEAAPIAPYVAAELAKGKKDKYGVLVYVGATWCEPCQRFHKAVEAGELDAPLRGVHLLEFDLDADRQALTDAGYASELIPLFAFPNSDGTSSDRKIQGSIKGPAAVDQNLLPRLVALLHGQAEN
jgi:thiol-disulfide isomerase/thioredoxin